MSAQQFVILSREGERPGAPLPPLGLRTEITQSLAGYNTSPEKPGDDVLWGPGIRIELPPGQDPVAQMLLTIVEEEIAWMVIMRLARAMKWRLLDPNTGRELKP